MPGVSPLTARGLPRSRGRPAGAWRRTAAIGRRIPRSSRSIRRWPDCRASESCGRPGLRPRRGPRPGGGGARRAALQRPSDARAVPEPLGPRPWPTDRSAALARLEPLALDGSANIVWLSDGLDGGDAFAFAQRLERDGSLRVVSEAPDALPRLLAPAQKESADLVFTLHRAGDGSPAQFTVRASGEDG